MSDRGKRLRTLLRVASIREKQAEAKLAQAEQDRRAAEATRDENVARLAEVGNLGRGTVAALDAKRLQTDLRIDAVVQASAAVTASEDAVTEARLRWQESARQRRSMEELNSRERAVQAVLATRATERVLDDALRARREATGGTQQ